MHSSMACGPAGSRTVPTSSGLLLWPASHPTNPAKVDLVLADLATCKKVTKNACPAQKNTAQQIISPDGVRRFMVGTAAQLKMQQAEEMTCAA